MGNDQEIAALRQLQDEIAYRREKRWRIFSWAATILTAIIGGLVTIKTDPHRVCLLSLSLRVAVLVSAAGISLSASFWILQNLAIEKKARELILEKDQDSPVKIVPTGLRWGGVPLIVLLFIGVCIALFL